MQHSYIVKVDEVRPLSRIVEDVVVLLGKCLADGIVLRIKCHFDEKAIGPFTAEKRKFKRCKAEE